MQCDIFSDSVFIFRKKNRLTIRQDKLCSESDVHSRTAARINNVVKVLEASPVPRSILQALRGQKKMRVLVFRGCRLCTIYEE